MSIITLNRQQRFCADLLRYGVILADIETEIRNAFVRFYRILYDGHTYEIIKVNGTWFYITEGGD